MNAYVLVGASNSRKSALIRSLTGSYNRNIREIQTLNGKNLRLYVRGSSLQDTGTSPDEFITEVREKAVRYALFSLWPHHRLDRPDEFPNAQGYLDRFLAQGWRMVAIAVVGQQHVPMKNPELLRHASVFPNTFMDPINVSAGKVRNFFAWL